MAEAFYRNLIRLGILSERLEIVNSSFLSHLAVQMEIHVGEVVVKEQAQGPNPRTYTEARLICVPG